MATDSVRLGATDLGHNRFHFLVWAPRAQTVDLHLLAPQERHIPLTRGERGYFSATVANVRVGTRYFLGLDGQKERPDPASRCQPEGVHGPSQVIAAPAAPSIRTWSGRPLKEYVIYEIHTGTYSAAGTFAGVIPYLDELRELGITALELMPVAQFPGERNWGYDGVYPFAVQASYGGPAGLALLVSACHERGMAVILDVVYNHLGPEGNYLADFGPYFTEAYHTPWGAALNFDGPDSDEVRRYFIENALYWFTAMHVDALRLDATHAIMDCSPRPFLQELAAAVHVVAARLDRRLYLIAENDRNDARLIQPPPRGGLGLDAIWSDDFHHALHTLLTGERAGYYQDFGDVEHLARCFRESFTYAGQYSLYRRRSQGTGTLQLSGHQFVVCTQNHDQVGNRPLGERLSRLVSQEKLQLAAGVMLLSPFLPLLFMGEEYGEVNPFLYFVSHTNAQLIEAVRQGRRAEFAHFTGPAEPPDPQAESTFMRSKLGHDVPESNALRELYRTLLRLRRELPVLAALSKDHLQAWSFEQERVLLVHRWLAKEGALLIFNFNDDRVMPAVPIPAGRWRKLLDSAMDRGSLLPDNLPGATETTLALEPASFALFTQTGE